MNSIAIPTLTGPIDAVVQIPGSKSLTNRALLIAALANGESILHNALFSEDSSIFSTCLKELGISVEDQSTPPAFRVNGMGGAIPNKNASLFVGNAGTAARFITAMLSLTEGSFSFDGVPAMRVRPMSELLAVLCAQGAAVDFAGEPGYMPFTLKPNGFRGGHIRLKADQTSQQLSALLMIAPYAEQNTTLQIEGTLVSQPYIDMTLQLMEEFGINTVRDGYSTFQIDAGQRYKATNFIIEPDASNASYFFAAAAVTGGRVRIENLSMQSLQGDVRFVEVLVEMGCTVNATDTYIELVGPHQLRGVDVDLNDISDTVPTLAAIAPFASSPVNIRNVAHIRLKETDRIAAVAAELTRLKIKVEECESGMTIYPGSPEPAEIQTYNDHRMAMAFSVTGLRAPGIVINNPACTHKTFPEFFTKFFAMTASVHAPGIPSY